MVLVDIATPWTVSKSNILYKCGWSPFEGTKFNSAIKHTFVNGHLAFENGLFSEVKASKKLTFSR